MYTWITSMARCRLISLIGNRSCYVRVGLAFVNPPPRCDPPLPLPLLLVDGLALVAPATNGAAAEF